MGPLSRPNHRQLSYHLARRFSGRRVDPVYHEKSVDEVAQIVGAPANTVKTRMFYARKRMENLLKAAGLDAH
jgi:hypothetical protein